MTRRLRASADFLSPGTGPVRDERNTRGCGLLRVFHMSCSHRTAEFRRCPVADVQQDTVFHLGEPDGYARRATSCYPCMTGVSVRERWADLLAGPEEQEDAMRVLLEQSTVKAARSECGGFGLIEDEIKELCGALALATAETPKGSDIQQALVEHMCSTAVVAWGGYTVCTFLFAEP